MKQEQRKYPRFDVVAKIRAKKSAGKQGVTNEAFVKNVSAEGFCFSSNEEFTQGEIIEVEISEDKVQDEPIHAKGEVVWCRKNQEAEADPSRHAFLTGVKVLGIYKSDEARFAMLYCERMLAELKNFLRM